MYHKKLYIQCGEYDITLYIQGNTIYCGESIRYSRWMIVRLFEETIVEQRARRDSEKCIVKLTGAVPLLAEPNCIKHSRSESIHTHHRMYTQYTNSKIFI